MKKICCLLVSLCLLQITFCYAGPPVLFFKKTNKVVNKQKKIIRYKVKKGEYLYSILRKFHINNKYIPFVLKDIKKINSQIKDLNKLFVGQVIKIPIDLSFEKKHLSLNGHYKYIDRSIANSSLDEIRGKYPFEEKKYKIKKGDCVVKLLMKIGGVPIHLIFNEYLTIFKKLNPEIRDINLLPIGTEVILPVLPSIYVKNKRENTIIKDKDITLLILEKLGFKIYNNTKLVYPTSDGEWIEIDTLITPLLIAQDESKILIVPEDFYNKTYLKLKNNNILICQVLDFSPHHVLKQIEKLGKNLKVWERGKSIIISQKEITLEARADIVVIKRYSANQNIYFLFYLKPQEESYNEKLMESILANYNIDVYNFLKNKREFGKVNKGFVNNIYVPHIPDDIKKSINKDIKLNDTLIKLPFKDNGYLYINVKKINRNDRQIYLVDNKNKSIAALLRASGYEAYTF